ncbi:MAG: potassium channel protein [Ignavibacteriae bacterium]|nr:potassium channel protein [Ignavibacteriota bacterium]
MYKTENIKLGFRYFKDTFLIFLLILICFSIGIVGYMAIEDFTFLEALYMTVTTISTVGFQEVHPLSDSGRIFTIFLIVSNIGLFFYGVTLIAKFIIEGEFNNFFKHYNVNKKIDKLENHVVVCGYGRTGRQICLELADDNIPFIVVESRENVIEYLKLDNHILFYDGDATEEETLLTVGIKKAKAIITTLPEDPDNVYVVLTARELNPDITIISRASNESSESKLKRAGANSVIMPEKIGGAHMAALVTKPFITDFIANLTGQGSDISLTFEELSLNNISAKFKNKTIRELDIRNRTGANLIGLRLNDGSYKINPSPDTVIDSDAKLILLGSQFQIQEMRKMISEV